MFNARIDLVHVLVAVDGLFMEILVRMNSRKFQKYIALKIKSTRDNGSFVIDEWVDDFLKDSPDKDQFIKIMDQTLLSAAVMWGIFSKTNK